MALVGNLKDLKLPNLVQLNCMERNTVKLTIEHAGKYGFVFFQNGQVVHVEYEPDIGEEAFYKLLTLNEGQFKVESGITPPMTSIKTSWNNLLLEGLHKLDSTESLKKTKEQELADTLMNVKGVLNAAVITADGQVLASTKEMDQKGILYAFTYLEILNINEKISKVEPKYVNIHEQSYRVLLTRYNNNIIFLELELKIQIDTIIYFIKKILS